MGAKAGAKFGIGYGKVVRLGIDIEMLTHEEISIKSRAMRDEIGRERKGPKHLPAQ